MALLRTGHILIQWEERSQESDHMAYDSRTNRMRRQEAVGMDELVKQFIKEMRLDKGMNRQRLVQVWNEVTGASGYTLSVNFDKGVLYCTISSSVVRNQLYFQREAIVGQMNEVLRNDDMFIWDWQQGSCIKTLVLR